MQQRDDNQVFRRIREFSKQFHYRNEMGLNIEIKDFLQDYSGVKKYSFTVDENNRYFVKILLENFTVRSAKSIFTSFLHFIEYSGATLYTRQEVQNGIRYVLISLTEDGAGFFMEIEFSPFEGAQSLL